MFLLSFLLKTLLPITLLISLFRYVITYHRYYKLAFRFPRVHNFFPNIIFGFIALAKGSFEVFQISLNFFQDAQDDVDLYALWLPSFSVFLRKPEHLQYFFTNKNLAEKSFHYDFLSEIVGKTSALTSAGEVFHTSRKVFVRSLNGISSQTTMRAVEMGNQKLLKIFEKNAGKGWFETASIIRRIVMMVNFENMIDMHLSYDDPLIEYIDEEIDHRLTKAIQLAMVVQTPLAYLSKIYKFTKPFEEVRSRFDSAILEHCVEKRRIFEEKVAKGEDIPDKLLYNIFQQRKNDPNMDGILDDLRTALLTGFATTATTVSSCLVLLGMHPEIQEKVFQEDKEIQTDLAGREMEDSDYQKYDLLNRVIKETLRLYPSVPVFARGVNSEVKLGNYILPKGSAVGVAIPAVHREPTYYPEPSKFDPDRFLPENVEKRPQYTYLPFCGGMHQCPGMRYGPKSALVLISSIVRNFEIISKYNSVEEMDKNVRGFVAIYDLHGYQVQLQRRTSVNYCTTRRIFHQRT